MEADICIVLRSSPDWAGMSREDFDLQSRAFCRSVGKREDFIVDVARLWDEVFTISYQHVRASIKSIAQSSLSDWTTQPDIIVGSPTVIHPNTFYLLTDDDDWFLPGLEKQIKALDFAPVECAVWGSAVLNNLRLRPLNVHCHSNNYAVTTNLFDRPDRSWSQIFHHGTSANEVFREAKVCVINDYLSIKNTHPGSTAYLEQKLAGDFSGGRLYGLVEQYVAALELALQSEHEVFKSCRAQIASMREVYKNIVDNSR